MVTTSKHNFVEPLLSFFLSFHFILSQKICCLIMFEDKMGFKNELWFIVVLILIGFGSSNIDQDRKECGEQLVGLYPCFPYVGGQAKAPTADCCSGLKQVIDKSMKCLCILIKDRNDPKLGLKVNTTLAAALPTTCHSPFNVTKCIDLLHLAPKSEDAKVFEEFANMTSGISSSIPEIPNTGNSSAEAKNGGTRKESLALNMVCGAFLFIIVSEFILSHIR